MMWRITQNKKTFLGGKGNPAKARAAAEACPDFREDSAFERDDEAAVSCYSCRYRRWTTESFDCMKGGMTK
jgi:hypothetical protein